LCLLCKYFLHNFHVSLYGIRDLQLVNSRVSREYIFPFFLCTRLVSTCYYPSTSRTCQRLPRFLHTTVFFVPFPLSLLFLCLYLCLAVHSQSLLYFLHSLSFIQVNFVERDERGSDCHLVSLGTDPFQDDTRVGPDQASKIRRQPHANDAPFLRTFKLLLGLTEIRHSVYNL